MPENDDASSSRLDPARIMGLFALCALVLACFLVLRPFLSALVWSVILVHATWPAFRLLRDRLHLSPSRAATIMVLAEFLLIGLPLVFAAPLKAEDIEGLRNSVETMLTDALPSLAVRLAEVPWVGTYLTEALSGIDLGFAHIAEVLRPYAGVVAQHSLSMLLAVLSGLAELLLAILLAWFIYRDGPALAGFAERGAVQLAGERARRLFALAGNVTRGVVYSLLGTATVQGLLTVIGLWVSGVPRPLLLGVVAGCVSIFPIGAPLVWIPSTLYLFAIGQTGWAIFLGLYGAFIISGSDNVVRPYLISRGADLPILLTLMGALGGVVAFGFLGLFLGPVLLALGYSVARDWAGAAVPASSPSGAPDP